MPSIGAADRASFFEDALKQGREIPWEEIVLLPNIIGGELRTEEDRGGDCCQGIISSITLENGIVSINCPWVLKTPMDEDGDPVGDYMREKWEVMKDPKLPLKIHVPRGRYQAKQEAMIHTALGTFATDGWAVRHSWTLISFFGGSARIYLKGHEYGAMFASVRELAPRFGLQVP